ncbi:MAG: EAL domain-containing protein [Cyanobacteriota bacterium]|nr:EAL domain-containing protein [Cyanobacteriota bacterium]
MNPNIIKLKAKVNSEESVGVSLKMAANEETDEPNKNSQGEALLLQQTAVAHLGQLAVASNNLSTLLRQATVLVCETLDVDFAEIWEYSEDGNTMRLRGTREKVTVASGEEGVWATKRSIKKNAREELETLTEIHWSSMLEKRGVVSSVSSAIYELERNKDKDDACKYSREANNTNNNNTNTSENLSGWRKVRLWGLLAAHARQDRIFSQDEINFLQGMANMLSQAIARDRSDRKLRLLASAVEYAEDSILITTTAMEGAGPSIVFVNSAFTRMTGYTAEEAIGQTPKILQGPKTDRAVLERLRENMIRGEVFYGEAINYRKDGTEFYNEWHIEPIRNDRSEVTHYLAIQRDMTERKKAEKQLYYKAFHDSLTGLPNRAMFMKRLAEALAQLKESPEEDFALLFMDLDCFKVINDSLGHLAGDKLLVTLAGRLETSRRPKDTVARLGGDEFGILLRDVKSRKQLPAIVEGLQKELNQLLTIDSTEIFSTASIGIVFSGDRDRETIARCKPLELMRDADIAMYRAKDRGKANSVIFDRTMHEEAIARLQLENDLRHALAREELRLYYQPIVNLGTNEIIGFEALVRWQHPERGMISPLKFIPLAEETGLIVPLGSWVLENACRQLRKWQEMFPSKAGLRMNVNLSGKQFVQKDLRERLEQILIETGIKKGKEAIDGCLKLEITESTIVENDDLAISMLEDFRKLGVKLAIDDFGTGYSSLSRLYLFPINTLKIDRSFVELMGKQGEKNQIVQTIISLAHGLGRDVVAEGIETAGQLASLKELGCEYGQGYFFSKPVDYKAATGLLGG